MGVRDILWCRVFCAHIRDPGIACLASLAERVVATVEEFALLKFVLQDILPIRDFAVHTERFLLLVAQFAHVNLVALRGIQRHARRAWWLPFDRA